MNKLASIFLSLFFAFSPAMPCQAKPVTGALLKQARALETTAAKIPITQIKIPSRSAVISQNIVVTRQFLSTRELYPLTRIAPVDIHRHIIQASPTLATNTSLSLNKVQFWTQEAVPLRHTFFIDSTGRPGALGLFCQLHNIPYTNTTLQEVITLISTTPQLRSNFIDMVQHNTSDFVYKLIKGLGKDDYLTLQTIYPPTSAQEEFSAHLGEDILNLFNALTSRQARKIIPLLNQGYVFISHFKGERIYLGSEFSPQQLFGLAQYILAYNATNRITRTDFLETFDPEVGQTHVASSQTNVTIQPERIFTFFNSNEEILFSELGPFLQTHPEATLKQTNYKKFTDVTYFNYKTGKTETKLGVVDLRKESLDKNLRELENLLTEVAPPILLLKGETFEENLRFMFNQLTNITPLVENQLRPLVGDEQLIISYRFGEHEMESKVPKMPLSNMHMHVEVYIPSLRFTYNVTIPLRATESTKAAIKEKFQEWVANGKPGNSFLEYYGNPSLWETIIPQHIMRTIPTITGFIPGEIYTDKSALSIAL